MLRKFWVKFTTIHRTQTLLRLKFEKGVNWIIQFESSGWSEIVNTINGLSSRHCLDQTGFPATLGPMIIDSPDCLRSCIPWETNFPFAWLSSSWTLRWCLKHVKHMYFRTEAESVQQKITWRLETFKLKAPNAYEHEMICSDSAARLSSSSSKSEVLIKRRGISVVSNY